LDPFSIAISIAIWLRTSQQEANAVALMQRHIRGALTRRAIKKQTTAVPRTISDVGLGN